MDTKYQNSKIYKVVDVGYNKCYIGSTYEELSQRMARHRQQYKEYLEGKNAHRITCFQLFEEFGITNCKIELLEYYPCSDKFELRKREGHYIQSNQCVNKYIAGRTPKEWVCDNKVKVQEYKKHYNEQHKQAIKEHSKQYYQENKDILKEKGLVYREKRKEEIKVRNKTYRENNPDKIKQLDKEYRAKNKDHLREYMRKYRERKQLENNS